MSRTVVHAAVASAVLGLSATHGLADVFNMGPGLTSLEWVTVGNPGNPDAASGKGGVDYSYRISKYEVTNAQYAEFLTAVEPQNTKGLWNSAMNTDPRGGLVRTGNPVHADGGATEENRYRYAAKPGMENMPVNFVSKAQAAQFVNWLHNGQPTVAAANGWIVSRDNSITFSGAYQMAAWNSALAPRLDGAKYFLPSEDEWVKAAYYQPSAAGGDVDGYWDFATASNTTPIQATVDANGNVTNAGANVVNYGLGADWNSLNGNVVAVGASGGMSYYGAFDMSGNVWEMTQDFQSSNMVVLGGSWEESDMSMLATRNVTEWQQFPSNNQVGFRVAALVPEPTSIALFGLLAPLVLRRRR